jgi:hypothetical protein
MADPTLNSPEQSNPPLIETTATQLDAVVVEFETETTGAEAEITAVAAEAASDPAATDPGYAEFQDQVGSYLDFRYGPPIEPESPRSVRFVDESEPTDPPLHAETLPVNELLSGGTHAHKAHELERQVGAWRQNEEKAA